MEPRLEAMRPFTLYVDKVQTKDIVLPDIDRRRTVTLDLELNGQHAADLLKYLTERVNEKNLTGVRIRLEGHLVHG